MHRQVTFIIRLWLGDESPQPSWQGQVECLPSRQSQHFTCPEELIEFMKVHTGGLPSAPAPQPSKETA